MVGHPLFSVSYPGVYIPSNALGLPGTGAGSGPGTGLGTGPGTGYFPGNDVANNPTVG